MKAQYLPGPTAVYAHTDVADHQEKNRIPFDARVYNQHSRLFPDFRSHLKGGEQVLLLPGHSLLSKSFLDSELGQRLVGSSQEQREAWAAEWVWPAVASFLLKSIFEWGVHFEAHFQNIDFLIEADASGNTVAVTPLLKDLGDVVDDPVLLAIQGKDFEEPVREDGPWAQQAQSFNSSQTPLEKKYSGKFGLFETSLIFGGDTDNPPWAKGIHTALQQGFAEFTAKEGFATSELMQHQVLNEEIYRSFGAWATSAENKPQKVLGKLVVSMRSIVMGVHLLRRIKWMNVDRSVIDETLQRFSMPNDHGLESNCNAPLPFKESYKDFVSRLNYGELTFKAKGERKIRVLAESKSSPMSGCLFLLAPISTE
jgi:hypothetical protein